MVRFLFAGTIFSSAFLLFLVQPLISKHILPWFGGSSAVWATCMVFFQVMLLGGYAYSDWITRKLSPRRQVAVHVVLLAASLATLSVTADSSWKPDGTEDPTLWILLLLTATIGLPYFLLSTTGPLVQAWVTRSLSGTRVYRFFSLSNLASLIALVSYPFLIEPRMPVWLQARTWSAVYIFFAFCCAASGFYFLRHARPAAAVGKGQSDANVDANVDGERSPGLRDHLLWLALSAMGSWLLLAVTNHITQNIAAVPLLWILPLSIYLLSFILCFESDRWYTRSRFLAPAVAALALCAYGLQDQRMGLDIKIAIPLYAAGLFFFCMFLHGELARMRPAPRYLTRFYLMIALGGAIGGIAVGLIAPRVLPAFYELGIGLVIVALLAVILFDGALPTMAATAMAVFCAYFLSAQIHQNARDARTVERSFYGSLRTVDARGAEANGEVRGLYNGAIRHGEQYVDGDRRFEPTTYYGRNSGIGLAIAHTRAQNKKVGLIGLGAGTLAVYGQPGDVYRFYEINPQVISIAQNEFTFLRDSKARIEIVQGDARLALERESPQDFDVLAVDAFSGDSIPVHLITREAMAVYLRHMHPEGVIAFHVSNRFLQLAPMVERLASEQGLHAVLISDDAEHTTRHSTDWVLVARDNRVLQQEPIRRAASRIDPVAGLKPWTDDFNNLFEVLK